MADSTDGGLKTSELRGFLDSPGGGEPKLETIGSLLRGSGPSGSRGMAVTPRSRGGCAGAENLLQGGNETHYGCIT
jgi:hypothetical protein